MTAFIAAAMSAALSIGGKANLTMRSRHGGRMRSRQSRSAPTGQARGLKVHGSPINASSTAMRVNASASPASSAAAAIVVLLRQPTRRPSGLPDRPFSNGRPRTCPDAFGAIPSVIDISFGFDRGPCGARDDRWDMLFRQFN